MQSLNGNPPAGPTGQPSPYLRTATTAMIDLTGAALVGHGNARTCFVHPLNSNLVIKVQRQVRCSRNQNCSEWLYLSSLVRRRVPFDHIPQLHSRIRTTLGEGLVFERIANPDGRNAPSLAEAMRQGQLSYESANALLKGLLAYLLHHWIVFADAAEGNLAWQHRKDGTGRLVILDGLGARHPGLKMWLFSHVSFLARRKTRKHWPRVIARLRAIKSCMLFAIFPVKSPLNEYGVTGWDLFRLIN